MKSMFDQTNSTELRTRLAQLSASSPRQWGRMMPAQAMAHCSIAMEMALGDANPPRVAIGYLFGPLVRGIALKDDSPMKKNAPTAPSMVVGDQRDIDAERARLDGLVDRFTRGGSAVCTTHPHAFFGRLTPEQWGVLMYKHLDHHLRQFGA